TFTGRLWRYRLEDPGNALGDLQSINDHELLVIERDGAQGPAAALKKIFRIDLSQIDAEGFVTKIELLDLLDIADPHGISTSTPHRALETSVSAIHSGFPLSPSKT
ncbi:MAG: esterase-like activity of phytase family protein, partial [Gammaproteobacteria bacterium]